MRLWEWRKAAASGKLPRSSMADLNQSRMIFSDLSLSRRLERAEAHGNAGFVEARARLDPESGAAWIDVAGAYAMYDGVSSPLTQTFGLGLFDPVTAAELAQIEEFFARRGAPVFHEVSPLADPQLLPLLSERGYRPFELTSVMFRPIHEELPVAKPRNEGLRVRISGEEEWALWAETATQGWNEFPELAEVMYGLAEITAKRSDGLCFLAELNEEAIATGVLILHEGVALLGGASTIPEGRRQGAQLALLENRLRYAAQQGCDLAMMCAQPGSASQRNAERQGFRIAYTRIKWALSALPR
jgi:GNAT superfamily N-acetyltransferase